jgi:hypothetical protein
MREYARRWYIERRGNCAQAVSAAWAGKYRAMEHTQGEAEPAPELAQCGGGRAPDGLCGALYAAIHHVPERSEHLEAHFATVSGGQIHCRAIRAEKRLSCADCVALGAELLEAAWAAKSTF